MGLPAGYVGSNSVNARSNNRRIGLTSLRTQRWVDPTTIDVDKFVDDQLGPAAAGTAALALTATLTNDYARNCVVTVTHASSIVAMTIVVTGTDVSGQALTESFAITATGTTKTVTGVKAFKTITSVAATVAADSSANTVNIGDGKVLGLNCKCSIGGTGAADKEFEDTTLRTTGVIVAGGASPADPLGTYTPNATLNGALDFTLVYFCESPQDS